MRVTTITYQKVYRLQEFVNERIGVEVVINEGESPEEALKMARDMVEEDHKRANPHLYVNGQKRIDPPHQEEPVVQEREIDSPPPADEHQQFSRSQIRLTKLINSTKDLDELSKFKTDAHKEGISYVYMARVKFFNEQLLTQ